MSRRRRIERGWSAPERPEDDAPPICPLCRRPIPPEARQSLHHVTPKLRGGKGGPTALLHQICHNEIHATFTEAELAQNTKRVVVIDGDWK